MASNKKKQDEKHLKILRDMVAQTCNKQCFDCHQRGPTYINMTIGSFVCTSCSGILRGLNPPHRVKSISMASFSPEELESLKLHSNELCRKVYLGLYDSRSWPEPDSKDEQRVRDFMVQKYENKRWYNAPTQEMKDEAKRMNEAAINKNAQTKPLRSLLGDKTPKLVLQTNHSPQTNRQHPQPISSSHGVIGQIPMPTSASMINHPPPITAQATQEAAPSLNKKSSFELLGEIGSDPFGNTTPVSMPIAPIGPIPPIPSSTTPFPIAGPGSSASTPTGFVSISSSSTTTPTVSDKYSAFADLFADPASTTNSNTSSDIWSNKSSVAPANSMSGGVPWGGVADTTSGSQGWGSSGTSAGAINPFSNTATQSQIGVGQTSHMGQPAQMMGQPGQINMGQAGQMGMVQPGQMGVGQMGMGGQTANPFASGLQDMSGKPAQPMGGTGFASWANPPAQTSTSEFFGHNGSLATSAGFNTAQPASGFWPNEPQGFAPAPGAGMWNQPQAANPFMQAANMQPVAPRGNSSNPFL